MVKRSKILHVIKRYYIIDRSTCKNNTEYRFRFRTPLHTETIDFKYTEETTQGTYLLHVILKKPQNNNYITIVYEQDLVSDEQYEFRENIPITIKLQT